MLKEAFLKGFAKKLSRFADDMHTVSKGVQKGKFDINVGASDDVKKFVTKELNKLKSEVAGKLEKTIKPKHVLGGSALLGLGIGAGGSLADKTFREGTRTVRDTQEGGYSSGPKRNYGNQRSQGFGRDFYERRGF